MEAALVEVQSQLGREYDMIIGGKRLRTEGKIVSMNPARPAQVIGIHQSAGAEHAEVAMQAAQAAFANGAATPAAERADCCFGAWPR